MLLLAVACTKAAETSEGIEVTDAEEISASDTLVASPADPVYQLIGTEPFWGLRIDRSGLRFTTPDDSVGIRFGYARAILHGDSLRWNSVASSGSLVEAVIVRESCSDGMSDKVWPWRARVQIDTTRYAGCAEPR